MVWQTPVRMFEREQLLKNVSKDSGLTKGAVHIDDWNKMSVSLMTQPFDTKAISALIAHINSQFSTNIIGNLARRKKGETNYRYFL